MASHFMQNVSFIYVFFINLTCTESLLSHAEECLSLFQFKQTIIQQDYAHFNATRGFHKFDSWEKITNNSSDCCMWDGVICSDNYNNGHHVIELDLSESFLHGPISSNSTLFNLVYLQKLNLSMNDFAESQIPSEIARLKQLRTLDLSDSSFSGQIPHEISYLVQLSSLNLSFNPLKLQRPSLLLHNLTRLEELHLTGVEINSFVPRFLANFSSLTSIIFNDCQLQDEFPSSIFHLPKLKSFSMRNNPNLSGTFPEFLNNTLLEYLELGNTSFAGIIPEYSISKLNHLMVLSLHNCYFSGPIPISSSNLTQLFYLSLRNNEFTGLVPSLVSLSKLTTLDISNINFDKGSLHDWIGKLTKLRELGMNGINLSGEILPSLTNLTKLSFMAMSGNFISGRILSSFMNLTQLTVIRLDGNQLYGPISSEFSNFKSLIVLHLGSNSFNGRVVLDTFVGLKNLKLCS